ncbi:hypothetical protein E3Q24_03981 [Wallemia mellicola]|nr:hypothetical protein E3Q24_03981 [Wallemia mellicola]TIC19784.1 hypothetical protein E3Q12_04074 [Wallemia mellicola]TIC31353.1 hypothetical protein E3Q09_04060 [Wallemia mellicola]
MNRSKPDTTEYKNQQDAFKSQIEEIQLKLQAVRQKISNSSANGPAQERRKALFNELNELKLHQSGNNASRGKVIDRIRVLQDSMQKKLKDLQASKSKIPFKTVDAIDDRVTSLDGEIESGTLRLADEKRALQEISNLRRHRKVVEGFAQQQQAIDADRAQIDALKLHLDDPESKALNDKAEEIKKGLTQAKVEIDQAQASRQTLFDQRNKLQADLDAVYAEKREHNEKHRETMDAYYQKVNEDKARRAQRAKEEREIEEAQKAKVLAEQIREDAKLPAFEAQIQDCQTLIDQFARIGGLQTSSQAKEDDGQPSNGFGQHNIRQVEDQIPAGTVLKKKNQEDDDAYFVGGAKSKKKAGKKTAANGSSEDKLNVPLATLTALMGLSIPPPKSQSEIQTTVESLEIKKAWYEANQTKQTKENVEKAEKEIEKLFAKKKVEKA